MATTNTLKDYIPLFYAQTALMQLRKVLGMGNRVFMGYDAERRAFRKGDTISIKRPSVFTAQDFTTTVSVQDIEVDQVQIVMNKHKDVTFALTDKELAYTGEQALRDHIEPAAYAIADRIDQDLAALALDIPHTADASGTNSAVPVGTDLADCYQVMFDNKAPMNDSPNMHFMMDGTVQNAFVKDGTFHQQQGAGDMGLQTQVSGTLGPKFGYNLFPNQNASVAQPNYTISDLTLGIDNAAGYNKDDKVINIDDLGVGTATGSLIPGAVLEITHADASVSKYAVTNTVAPASGAWTGVAISPGLRTAVDDDDAVAVLLDSDAYTSGGLGFHRNAFALAFAPLSPPGVFGAGGTEAFTAQDPVTGLSVRALKWHEGKEKQVYCSLDVLYGVKTLDPDLAVRFRRDTVSS